jgi:trehalose 6-phosphate phosphatase
MPPLEIAPRHPIPAETALSATAARVDNCVFFFDFDGTLAPIGDDPDAVHPAPGVVAAIRDLIDIVRHVTIVSARPVAFLRSRFPDLPLTLHGLYGLESQLETGETVTFPPAAPYADMITELAARAERELPADVLVEFKRLSVALHYRTAPDLRDTVHAWAEAQATRLGLREQEGRMVIELKPSVQRDKGSVVTEDIAVRSCAWYFGDDLGDLTAFRALTAHEADNPNFLGVRVAVGNPETGAEVAAAADLHLDGPSAVPPFLREVLTALG